MPAPLLTLLAVAAYGFLHSLLAGDRAKSIAARLLGEPGRRGYRLAYNAFALVSLWPVLAIPARDPGRILYAFPWPWAGVALAGQGLAFLGALAALWDTDLWSFLGLRQIFADRPAASASALFPAAPEPGVPRLVVRGLYRWVRHPIYTFSLIFLWLTPVMTTSLLALYGSLSAYLVVGSVFEERRLVAEFGEAYRAYQRRVPRLVPFGRARPG
ncbi:MAG: methyltransferase family protein [Anaerolineales bacterium]